MDGSGVVDAVGAGVDPARVGESVWLHRAAWKRPGGTCAEYCVVPHTHAVTLPAGIDLRAGATLGVPALTAHRAVFGFGEVRGRTVLVTGGAGAVGFYAIQLARWGGARVIATASDEAKQAEALRAGAEAVIDYRHEDVAQRVRALTAGAGVDHLVEVDFGGNLAATTELMKPYGTIAAYASMGDRTPALPFYPMQLRALSFMIVALFDLPAHLQATASAEVSQWLREGTPRFPATREFSLAQVAEAHEAVEQASAARALLRLAP
jgi:NADPH2:quinone reductase